MTPTPGALSDTTGRLDRWRDLIREHFVGLDIASGADEAFRGSVRSSPVGHLTAAVVESVEQDCVRTTGLARRDPDSYLQVGLLARGRAVLHQDGREALLGPGGYAVYETDRPFSWHFEGPWRLLVLTWPREAVDLSPDESRDATARALGGDHLGRIVGRALTEVVAAPPPLSPTGGRRLADELAGLVGTVAGEVRARSDRLSPRVAAELRRRVEDHVAEHLDDPDLDAEAIARAHFVSTQQLHRAFADACTSVTRLVRTRRVEHGARELRGPRAAHLSVTEIARRCGFSDLSAFSRAFKETFGEPPSTYRGRRG